MSRPISYVIPAYNCAAWLPAAVRSIVDGNLEAGDEILIVNDGSTDDTAGVMQKLAASQPAIRLFTHRVNKGSAAAGRNTAIDQAMNALIFCLDADNLLHPGSIAPLKRHLIEQNADIAAFQELHYFSEDPAVISNKWVYKSGPITLADALAGHVWPGPDGNYLFTVDIWKRAGRYVESVGGGIDSWAFGIRQLAAGAKMVCLPGTSYLHRSGHQSAWIRDAKAGGQSLKALSILLPLLDRLEPETVEYLFAKESRDNWFEKLDQRPLRLKGMAQGESGSSVSVNPRKRSLITRIRNRMAMIIAPK